jgi:hypothetical protein
MFGKLSFASVMVVVTVNISSAQAPPPLHFQTLQSQKAQNDEANRLSRLHDQQLAKERASEVATEKARPRTGVDVIINAAHALPPMEYGDRLLWAAAKEYVRMSPSEQIKAEAMMFKAAYAGPAANLQNALDLIAALKGYAKLNDTERLVFDLTFQYKLDH